MITLSETDREKQCPIDSPGDSPEEDENLKGLCHELW